MQFKGRLFIFLLFYFGFFSVFGQELPPVISFSPEEYRADNQNWSITQCENKHLFVANNKGLLEYNGESWLQYDSPNKSIIRSVYAHNGRIYSGCFREFGYWERSGTGELNYTSLIEGRDFSLGENEEFWTIFSYSNWILFQSLDAIYMYNTTEDLFQIIKHEKGVTKLFKVRDEIYFSVPSKGVFKITNGKKNLVSDAQVFRDNLVINLYDVEDLILVQTSSAGIYTLGPEPVIWPLDNVQDLRPLTVYNSLQTIDGNIILGTVSEGVIKIDGLGNIIFQITKNESLSNNTVLAVFEDRDGNIWLGLDNGIDCINQNSPVRIYYDKSGALGTVYSSLIFDNNIYLGTNQGVFYKSISGDSDDDFKLIPGSVGQVWSLFIYDNQLFVGHNEGTFLMRDNVMIKVSDEPGTWCLRTIPGHPDKLLQGNYRGLSILKKTAGEWQLKGKLEGFNISSRYIDMVDQQTLLVSHEYKGVFTLGINEDFTKVISVKKDTSVEKGLYSSLARFQDQIYYANEKGIWQYNHNEKRFSKDSFLSLLYNTETYSSGKLISTKNQSELWVFSKGSIRLIAPGKLSGELEVISLPIRYSSRNAMVGYENIYEISENLYLFGNTQGYFLFNLADFKSKKNASKLSINSAIATSLNSESEQRLPLSGIPILRNHKNQLFFSFSIPEFEKYFATEYQYKLAGLSNQWSPWQSLSEVTFSNLPYGNYSFNLRGRIGDSNITEEISYSFVIKRPFILSNTMLVLYFILLLFIFILVHLAYKAYYKRQKKLLKLRNQREIAFNESENKRKLMKLKNEKLQQDIESKNRELAISTMSLIKKNKVLNGIKGELGKFDGNEKELKRVISMINKNLKSSDDWEFFERAFNNADREFFKKVKAKHPGLTPDDLRLCAYLRLNLSSKEIAPLLSISPKSVEIKRYRLRKKMELPSNINLTNYILEI